MIAMSCERVAPQSLPAVMCLDASGAALFATSEAYRLCDRWNDGLSDDVPESPPEFRLPDAIGNLLDAISLEASCGSDPRQHLPAGGLRLRHPSVPELAVTVELGEAMQGKEAPYYLLVFAADQQEADTPPASHSPEGRKALEQLTPRERKVALLVTEGLRNGEIAAQLQRSRRTIEYQLNAIYRKLDLSCRTQLVRALV
jgi:DNA-binding CsgD family transcriptional regulator